MNLEKFWAHPKKEDVKRQIGDDIISGEEEEYFLKKDEEDNGDNIIEKYHNSLFVLQTTEKLLEETDVSPSEIYSWYAQAMQRRDREPLAVDSFYRHFFGEGSFDQTFAYGDTENGYVLGFNKFGVFTPTHFAPKSLRGGYNLFVALGESQKIPTVLAITEDIAATLDKMPDWHSLEVDKEILSYLRGEIVKKKIYYNSHPEVENLMLGLLMEYMKERNNIRENNDDDLDDEDTVDEAA